MFEENEILDQLDSDNLLQDKGKNINLVKYTFIYSTLMLLIGSLITKLSVSIELKLYHLLFGAISYIGLALIIALIQELIRRVYNKTLKKSKTKMVLPFWFRILESTFHTWGIIILVVCISKFML